MVYFFVNDTATTEIYTLSLHDALPICEHHVGQSRLGLDDLHVVAEAEVGLPELLPLLEGQRRSEEHTAELQSRQYLVCRLLLEKKIPPLSLVCPAPSLAYHHTTHLNSR